MAWVCPPSLCAFFPRPRRFTQPSRTSMRPTENSIERPMRGGMTRVKTMMPTPTAKMVMVWPAPQRAPIQAAVRMRRSRLTMVETATTWSASVACRMPRTKPRTRIESRLNVVEGDASPDATTMFWIPQAIEPCADWPCGWLLERLPPACQYGRFECWRVRRCDWKSTASARLDFSRLLDLSQRERPCAMRVGESTSSSDANAVVKSACSHGDQAP